MFIVIFICTHNMFMPILCECDRACLLYRCMSADSGQPEYRVLLLFSRMNARQNGRWNLQLNEVGHQKSCLVYLHLKQEECHHWVVDIQSQRCHRNHNACGWCDNLLLYLLQSSSSYRANCVEFYCNCYCNCHRIESEHENIFRTVESDDNTMSVSF